MSRKRGPLSWWWVGLYAVIAVAIGAGATWWAWPPTFPTPDTVKDRISAMAEQTKAETDAIRTGLAAAGGAGAVFTLLLAVRRQRSTEEDSQQQRMTELYTAAAEQLGHERAAVRLAGLYALQRLGQTYPEQRRLIVNVWCAYLRMPFRAPDTEGLDEHAHSGPGEGEPALPQFWGEALDVDLTGATLYELDLRHCRIHPRTIFNRATFIGRASFTHTTFTGIAWFGDATFTDGALFAHAAFTDATFFGGATFTKGASFHDARFTGYPYFSNVTFTGSVSFRKAALPNGIDFTKARAQRDRAHVWPAGWELVAAERGDVPGGEDPDVAWGWLVRVPAESGADPDEPTTMAAESISD